MIVSKVINNNIGQSLNSLNQKRVIDPFFGSIVSAGGSLLGGAFNSIFGSASQRRENARNRAHQELMLQKQQDYNDKINAENREWTTESNVRRRIEDAGYNPYLYNGQASANAVNSNSAGSASPESAPATFNPSFGQALQNAGSSFAQSYNSFVNSSKESYDLKQQQVRDEFFNKEYNVQGGEQSAQTQSNINLALSQANKNDAEKLGTELINNALGQQAVDANGTPMTKPDGTPMTIADQRALGDNKKQAKEIELIGENIKLAAAEGNLKWLEAEKAKFLKNAGAWNIDLQTAQQTLNEIVSRIKMNIANANLMREQQRDLNATRGARIENLNSSTNLNNANARRSNELLPYDKANSKADTRNKNASARGQEIQNYKDYQLRNWDVNGRKYAHLRTYIIDGWNAMQAPGDLMYKRASQGLDILGNLIPFGGLFRGSRSLGSSAPTYSTPSLPVPRPALPAPRGYLPYKR